MSPKRKKKLLVVLNILAIVCLCIPLFVYGRVFYYEAKYSIASVFSNEIKQSQKYFDGLPRRVAAGSEIALEPIVQIPKPKDQKFSVIITKLGINQKVTANVDINDGKAVANALRAGIGWAQGTVKPGDEGNSLIFSHSTVNAWDIWRYNAEFTLLRKMEINDVFTVVYEGRQMDFLVFEKTVVPASDKSYITSSADGRVVTLQTCDPPGDNANRLLVRGRLVAMEVQ